VLALGPSTDRTNELVDKLVASDPRIHTVHNKGTDIPIGLNLAIKAALHPVIVRVDAHTELPPHYTENAVETLLRENAANVGGIMVAVGEPGLQSAIARAYNSRFGLGGGAYHHEDVPAGEAESAYLGVMRADALAAIGGFDETLRRGEDWELNYRLRSAGYRVWLDPKLRVSYWPRRTWKGLVKQFWATGKWRGELWRRLRTDNSPRFFVPPTLVLATVASLVLTPLALVGVGGGPVVVCAAIAGAGPAAYVVLLAWAALTSGGSAADRGRFCLVLAAMHYAWGAGFVVGALRGARNTVDTSRV
jgi:glycosyltransferase involved in cell wall biosynthesis